MKERFLNYRSYFIAVTVILLLLSFSFGASLSAQENNALYVKILNPKSGEVITNGLTTLWGFVFGQRVSLFDKEDYQWYSDKDGFLEYGRVAHISGLSLGVHRITLTIGNGDVSLASDTVGVVVRDQYIDKEPKIVGSLMPNFPQDYEVKGVLGVGMLINETGGIDSVLILDNTVYDSTITGFSEKDTLVENIALQWAGDSEFEPAEERGVKKSTWTARRYLFPPVEEEEEIDVSAILDKIRSASRRSRTGGKEVKKPKVYGKGEPVAVTGMPDIILQRFEKVTKKKSLPGMIKACVKVDVAGLVTEILIIEDTFKDDWVEEHLTKMLSKTLYEPVMEEDGPSMRECYTAFIVEDNHFKEMKEGDFTNWKDEYQIKFSQLEEGEKPNFSKKEEDVKKAVGLYRIIAEINTKGEVKNIKEINKSMNRGSLRGIFKDAYEDRTYQPAIVKSYPVKSYILPYFRYNNPDGGLKRKLILSYNSGFQFYIKKKYKMTIKDFKDALFMDTQNDFLGLIPQIIFCYESKKEQNHNRKIELYEQAIWKNAYYRDFEVLQKLCEERAILKESIDKKTSFFSLLPEDSYNLNEIFSFFDESEIAGLEGDPNQIYTELKYPKKAREVGFEGTVDMALLLVDMGGQKARVKYARVLTSTGDKNCDKAAAKALKKGEYRHATIGIDPTNSWIKEPVFFTLLKGFAVRGEEPSRDEYTSRRAAKLSDDKIKYSLQVGLPPVLSNGKNRFSKANDETNGSIKACVTIDSTGFVHDILMLSNNISKDSLRAMDDFARMLAESVFDPVNLSGGPEKQKFVCSYKVEDRYFSEQRKVVMRNWLETGAFKFPEITYDEEVEIEPDTTQIVEDSTANQSVNPQEADVKSDSTLRAGQMNFGIELDEI
ncbi:energy transducer TonB, partial [bacterium]|nr:energy transducer TonB [bacterium]